MGEAYNGEGENILVVLPFPEPKKSIEMILKKHPKTKITYKQLTIQEVFQNKGIPDDEFKGYTVLFVLGNLPSSPKLIPNVKFIQLASAGVNHLAKTPIYKDSNIPIATASGIHGPMISEWVIMQILSNSHKQRLLLQWQKEHKWGPHSELGALHDGVGMRLGVLGYGSIGRQAARVCKAMGMDVIAYTASPRTTPESKRDNGYIVPGTGDIDGEIPSAWYSGLDKASLHKFLSADIDVLLVSVPLTEQTLHFIGKEEFALLGKHKAFIANISRGSILKQDDLIASLKSGELRGAALDVTDPEPLNKESELWDLENVAITPHTSGLGVAYVERCFEVLERNLTHTERGERLINLVDRKKGY